MKIFSGESGGPTGGSKRQMESWGLVLEFLGFPAGSGVKKPPAMQETWVPSLGREDPLEEEMATHSSILAWEIPWTEEPEDCGVTKESDLT